MEMPMNRRSPGKARIVAVTARCANGYHWQWRADDGAVSGREFDLFYECLSDARRAGYTVDLGPPPCAVDAPAPHTGATGS
jgi:hypothetical protein